MVCNLLQIRMTYVCTWPPLSIDLEMKTVANNDDMIAEHKFSDVEIPNISKSLSGKIMEQCEQDTLS